MPARTNALFSLAWSPFARLCIQVFVKFADRPLFLDIDLPNDIRLARSHAAAALELPDTPFRPHISLAYGFTNGGASVDLLGELRSKYVDRRLVLSAFACVNSSSQTDIKDWKIYFKHSFAGRS